MASPKPRGLFKVCPKSGRIVGYNFGAWWACALFPLLGLLAFVWVMLRVSMKPSRAAYPCMKVAMPLAGGFVGYLASLVAAVVAVRQAKAFYRRSRFALAGACLAAGLAAAVWCLQDAALDVSAASTGFFTPSDAANTPAGTAQGIHPGRVTWVHDPAATSWDGSSSYWWSDGFNSQPAVNAMLSQAVLNVSGQATVAAAWDALFKHRNQLRGKGGVGYASTEKIAVKINLNCGGNNQKIDASPHMVFALLDQLVNQAGVPQAAITLYDAQRGGIDAVRNRCSPTFPSVKYNSWGSWVNEQISYSAFITDYNARRLPQAVVEAEYMINLAILKRHCQPTDSYSEGYGQTGITVCGKNHFGTIGNTPALHERCRDWYWGMPCYNDMVDLIGSRHLGGKTVLYLVDGLYAGDRHDAVPKRWQMTPFNGDWPSSLLASQDPVAVDSVALDFLRSEWPLVAHADNYLHEAALRDGSNRAPSGTQYKPDGTVLGSLGVHEHWNNATDKKYSRNLGTGAGIELVALSSSVQPPSAGPGTGITREWWTGIAGTAVADLTGNAAFPDSPTGSATLTSLFEAPTDWADNYGTRVRGTVIAPVTGDYVFWIAADDNAELWLSTDGTPASKVKIASVSGWTGSREWTKLAGQQSAAIRLTAGQRYYVEALQKEGTGGDNLAVGWQFPNGALERPIPYHRLAPWADTYALTVNSGSGDGSYAAGAAVTITADAPPSGQLFDRWRVDAGSPTLANATSATTTLTMPASAATVTATYKAAPPATYALTVNSGSGDGSYAAGAAVTITADAPPSGQVFDRWRIDAGSPTLANAASATTTLTMPASAATVTATYKTAPPPDTGTGLWAEIFDNADFTARKLSRTDASVNFDWGAGSPDASVGADAFSVRWSGAVQPRYSETYTFTTTTDDGVRLWVDGQLLVDQWVNQGPTDWSGTIALTAGRKIDIRMDYYENGGGAVAKLSWSSASQAREIIPQGRLFPWSSRDIGSVGVAGSDTVSGSNFTVKGSGADIWNNADAFRYVYKVLTGDGEVQVKVSSVQNTNGWAKAGVMVRETLAADSRHAFMALTPGNGLAFQRRTSVGGSSSHTSGGAASPPRWVRLVRQGASLSGYASADGAAWTWIGTETVAMGSVVFAGLAVTSHDNAVLCTAQLDGAAVTAGPDASVPALVAITSVSTAKPYSLATAQAGALPYIDRSYTVTALSAALDGGVLVRTSNDDKYITAAGHLVLTIGQSAKVYVGYDKRGTLPAWLSDGTWTATAESFVSTDGAASPMRVYLKTVPAGSLTLGGNLAGGASGALADYVVVVQPAAPGKPAVEDVASALAAPAVFVPGPVPPDRWLHEADRDGDGMAETQDGDGDGLWNTFEPGYGVDIVLPDSDADGGPDETVTVPDGRTLWDVQEGFPAGGGTVGGGSSGGGGGGGGSHCGSIGLDLMAPLALLWALRRRGKKRQ